MVSDEPVTARSNGCEVIH